MTHKTIITLRLAAQQLASAKLTTPAQVVAHMGAVQSQDYSMSKWAVGIRLRNSSDAEIESALDRGEIIRTHLLRPTWHLVNPQHIHWMLALSAPQIKRIMKSQNKFLGITEKTISKSNNIIEAALAREKNLTRDELLAHLEKGKIKTGNLRSSHLLMQAEIDGIICSGARKNNKLTYALLNERVPVKKKFVREEALAKLALIYFTSHGPATVNDFAWWSGLTVKDATVGLELVKKNFVSEKMSDKVYYMSDEISEISVKKNEVHLLPAFDEFLISYKDRTASLAPEHHRKAFTVNGIFFPTIVISGTVTGLWKRTIKNEEVKVTTEFFQRHNKTAVSAIEKAIKTYRKFLGKATTIAEPSRG